MQPQLIFLAIAFSALIGYLGRDKPLRFWGHFLLSLLLSPVVGLLALGLEEWIDHRSAKTTAPANS